MQRILAAALAVMALFCSQPAHAEQRLTFGRFKSRAIFNRADPPASASCRAPLVILVPGSGANGPEEMIPGKFTGDGQDHSIFASFAEGLRRGHVGTLAIGKPGLEFFSSWSTPFYDEAMYRSLGWQDLLDNLADAVEFAKTLDCVDPDRIIILGHSEGTQVAIDFANQNQRAARALILVGFAGESLATTVDWQLFRRDIDAWIAPDVDRDHDGFVSRAEASAWPEFIWTWKDGQDRVSFAEIENARRADPELLKSAQTMENAKIWSGVFHRAPLYDEAVALPQALYVFTGTLDVQTRPEEALRLLSACQSQGRGDCKVELMPGLGHGMSRPKGPRAQKLLDMTLGPVDESFLQKLAAVAAGF